MAKRKRRTHNEMLASESLIFIDTNIFLDFYRMETAAAGMNWLSSIESNLGRLISTCQIEMEFKKNRQKVILETQKNFRSPKWDSLKVPPILLESQAVKQLEKSQKEIRKNVEKINKEILRYIQYPQKYDPIYKTLEQLFQHKSSYILDRDHEKRRLIKHKARTRFSLGYPPRKNDDTSFGDALNWEWILWCADESKKPIIIVSRDSDYGHPVNGSCLLNSWLSTEFSDRVAKKRPIFLTNRLAEGFKRAGISLPDKAIQQEQNMISQERPELEITQRDENI